MGDIINFPGLTRKNIDPNKMLKAVEEEAENLTMAVVVGITEDGRFFVATSQSHDGDTLMLLERGKDIVIEKYRYDEDND